MAGGAQQQQNQQQQQFNPQALATMAQLAGVGGRPAIPQQILQHRQQMQGQVPAPQMPGPPVPGQLPGQQPQQGQLTPAMLNQLLAQRSGLMGGGGGGY